MAGHRRKIYIVEDDPTLGSLEAHILNTEEDYEANWELLSAGTFERVQNKRPDLIFVEVPPDSTSKAAPFLEFLDRVAADPQTAAIPVMAIATDDQTADRLAARPGVRAVLAKPYDVEALLNTVADCLDPLPAA